MEKKAMNTRLAAAAVVLLFGLMLAGRQEAAAAAEEAATATDAAEAPTTTTPSEGKGGYGKSSKADCEIAGTCDVKVKLNAAAADSTRPGAKANEYTRGCSKIHKCRD